jgi:tRNA threonylcarbamoyladenosine biosynthesis protein TsaB
MILAIDGSTNWCCIALAKGSSLVAEKGWLSKRGHTVDLTSEIAATLRQVGATLEQIEGVVVATGPGSFSGLRAAMAVAKGIAFARGIPIVGIPTMDALAALAYPSPYPVWCIIQLGRGRVAAARYRVDALPPQRLDPYGIYVRGRFPVPVGATDKILGDWDAVAEPVTKGHVAVAVPWWGIRHCASLAYLGGLRLQTQGPDDPLTLEPIYVSGPPAPGSAQL